MIVESGRRVSIEEARELSKSREYTILWRPDGKSLGDTDEHYAIAQRYIPSES